ncbi:hypothetical protein GRF29_1g1051339 [Pseudopithomyces chartarum]|uniref:Tat pathway signal sequence n=1 Tax=Pseudopithomyces chartarum TaxID=1892770 RepID=A0AAN6M5I7_9PLEO|nr:hypothetical protein GRF29_1g1051339 [Pseudopithomyces chartarum]
MEKPTDLVHASADFRNGAEHRSIPDFHHNTVILSPKTPAPVFDRFNIPKVTRTTNGTFWDTDPPSIWRARTGSDADAAWDSIGNTVQPIIITTSDVRQLGKDPNTAVRAPAELNLGPDAFIAGMDVFHHLHCLDKLRREISYKHYHEATEGPYPGSEMHEAHINHCLDVLQQALRCTGSVDIVTFNWVEGHKLPQPDFNNRKMLRAGSDPQAVDVDPTAHDTYTTTYDNPAPTKQSPPQTVSPPQPPAREHPYTPHPAAHPTKAISPSTSPPYDSPPAVPPPPDSPAAMPPSEPAPPNSHSAT